MPPQAAHTHYTSSGEFQSDRTAERAFRHVEAIADQPHPVGTAAHLQARNYIVSELQALGLSPQLQETTFVDPESPAFPGKIVAGTVKNVIARLAGTAGNQAILLVCHYDSVATAPGASDDGSGVATLLETARALQAGPALKNSNYREQDIRLWTTRISWAAAQKPLSVSKRVQNFSFR